MGGGNLGTIFDIAVLKTDKGYEMFSSWRPQNSPALPPTLFRRLTKRLLPQQSAPVHNIKKTQEKDKGT